jgi:hypothetical protein
VIGIGNLMPKIKLVPIIKSITIALIFFALGRIMLIQLGTMGIVIAIVLVLVFYIFWAVSYRRGKKK